LSFNEIQPFAIDYSGNDLVPAFEILKASGATTDQDCSVLINGRSYAIAAGDLGAAGGLVSIEQLINAQSQVVRMPLNADANNDLQMIPASVYSNIQLPLSSSAAK